MVKIHLYGIRLTPPQHELVEKFLKPHTYLESVSIHKLSNNQIQLFTYEFEEGHYQDLRNFESREEFLGYCRGVISARDNPNAL